VLGADELVLATAIAVGAAAAQGTIGFGMALVSAPLLTLVDPAFVPVPLLLVNLPLSALACWRERGAVDARGLPWALAGRLPGTVAGAWLVATTSARTLQVAIGGAVLLATGASCLRSTPEPTPPVLVAAGTASGVMGTAASVGGPPIAFVYARAGGPALRATLAAFFLVGTTMSIVVLAYAGQVGRHELGLALALVPGTVVGFALSGFLTRHVDRGRVRATVLATAAISAAVVLVEALV
jgi:uncharacterized protein